MSGVLGELLSVADSPNTLAFKSVNQLGCLGGDVLGKTERLALLRHSHRPRCAGPIVNILEKVMMDRTEMCKIQLSFG